MTLPDIPKSWLIGLLLIGLIVMRFFGIDTFVTAGMSALIGFLTGSSLEKCKNDNDALPKL